MKKTIFLMLLLTSPFIWSQEQAFSRQDSLRGSITPERAWWDLNYYHLDLDIDPDKRYISGSNEIHYTVLNEARELQIDLQPPLKIDRITTGEEELSFRSEGNAHFIELRSPQEIGSIQNLKVYYSGNPRTAVRAPWDGGFSWDKDQNGNHFVATSCQGLGASAWWPNKDHMYDEVDSMAITLRVPKGLTGVANGRLRSSEETADRAVFHWFVSNPINNYGVNANIGDYVHFGSSYQGEKGVLDLDYYVLRDNLEKAKVQFSQVPKMMEAFEYWFGPYPFYEDSFKLVEVPYLGMEHQSSVTYGNKYQNGYLGQDLSASGWGSKFDFIIIHEAGHEWFANSITNKDIADMWVHEGFTAYSENLYLDYHYGPKAAADYVIGTRRLVQNDSPIIGPYDVNQRGSNDMYYKGSNILHMLRQLVEDDELWRQVLRGLNEEFYHQTVSSAQVEDYISAKTGKDLSAYFNQYLRTRDIPTLEYRFRDGELSYRYTDIVQDFDMPVKVSLNGDEKWIFPAADWKTETLDARDITLEIDRNFYVYAKMIDP